MTSNHTILDTQAAIARFTAETVSVGGAGLIAVAGETLLACRTLHALARAGGTAAVITGVIGIRAIDVAGALLEAGAPIADVIFWA